MAEPEGGLRRVTPHALAFSWPPLMKVVWCQKIIFAKKTELNSTFLKLICLSQHFKHQNKVVIFLALISLKQVLKCAFGGLKTGKQGKQTLKRSLKQNQT